MTELSFIEIIRKIFFKKNFIFRIALVGILVGAIIAFSIPKEYTSTVILITGSGDTSKNNMGALASIAGINIGSSSGEDILSPDLYSDVLSSTPFIKKTMHLQFINPKTGSSVSLFNYYKDFLDKTWWMHIVDYLVNIFRDSSFNSKLKDADDKYYISNDEIYFIEQFTNNCNITTNKKTGVTTIKVRDQNPKVSAYLADTITSQLQLYIIEARTKKAKIDLENSEKLYNQSKEIYYDTQERLAEFLDTNVNLISLKYKIKQEKLQNEANIAYQTYNQMAQQVQMNKIKIQDYTPVFTIIQPSIEPLVPTAPNKKMIVMVVTSMFILIGSIWIIRDDLKEYLKK